VESLRELRGGKRRGKSGQDMGGSKVLDIVYGGKKGDRVVGACMNHYERKEVARGEKVKARNQCCSKLANNKGSICTTRVEVDNRKNRITEKNSSQNLPPI